MLVHEYTNMQYRCVMDSTRATLHICLKSPVPMVRCLLKYTSLFISAGVPVIKDGGHHLHMMQRVPKLANSEAMTKQGQHGIGPWNDGPICFCKRHSLSNSYHIIVN